MTKPPPLRVACVGAGYFSRFHYESWSRDDRVTIVGSCDHDLEKAKATGLPAFQNVPAMIAQTKPDLLDIILPPAAHAETVRAGIAAGVKTMICQKPFCASLAEAHTVVAQAKAAGVTIIIHENFRFQPWYRRIKAALDADAIGTVLQATFRLRPGDGQGPRAYLDRQPYFQQMEKLLISETGVHWIDTFRFLFGDPISVYADLRQINPVLKGEDAGFVLFEHPGGVRSLFDGNRNLDHAADNLRRTMGEAQIEGTQGSLTLTGDGSVHLRAFGSQSNVQISPPDTWPGFGGDCVHALQSHVISGLVNGSTLENIAEDYLKVLEIVEMIYASAQDGRKRRLTYP